MKRIILVMMTVLMLALSCIGCAPKEDNAEQAATEASALDVDDDLTIEMTEDSDYVVR